MNIIKRFYFWSFITCFLAQAIGLQCVFISFMTAWIDVNQVQNYSEQIEQITSTELGTKHQTLSYKQIFSFFNNFKIN